VPSEQARAATLRRRISSVEDLLLLASGAEETKAAMTTPVPQQEISEDHPPAELARTISLGENCISFGEKLTFKSPDEPCVDPACNGICGGRPVLDVAEPTNSAFADAPGVPVAEVSIRPVKAAAAPVVLPVPVLDKASAFESAFFSASQHSPPGSSPILPPSPIKPANSLIDSLKTHPSVLGTLSNGSSPPAYGDGNPLRSSLEASRGSIDLDSRRNSCDLGHVAPSSGHLGQGSAAVELFYRLNHARQTVDYVKRQAAQFAPLNRASMDVWEALDLLNTLREYESALLGNTSLCDPDMPLLDHAFQTAEACRIAFPQHEWMPIVGLIHGLGKLLAHGSFGGEPQWAVCGESFPVGCRFHPSVVHSQYFQANPDRRRRAYATATGVYQQGCGLSSVCMSWSGAEYLYMVLARNRTQLPAEALFLIRYQKFAAVLRPGQPYGELLSQFDRSMLPMLEKFRELAVYTRQPEVPGRLQGDALKKYYDDLLAKYIPQGKLRW
jgi:inositol oxygenase